VEFEKSYRFKALLFYGGGKKGLHYAIIGWCCRLPTIKKLFE